MLHNNYVYILANQYSHTLYIGVTSNLTRRICEHKCKQFSGFTEKYNVDTLVYYECFGSIEDALRREKQIKGWTRAKKIALIEENNPDWLELPSS